MFHRLIYELLPLLYSLAGTLAVIRLDSTLGRISGALLLSAAVAVHTLRRVYRGEITMKMAKASESDLNMATTLANYCDSISRTQMPDALSEDAESIEWLDSDDCEQYARLLHGLQELLDQGSISRVVWGMAVVCNPSNMSK